MIARSFGLSSKGERKKRRSLGLRRRLPISRLSLLLREQLEHRLVRLVGDRQRRDFQLLPRLQGQQVGAFLVLADQNEESANLLTLQTRQQLEVSALSIANQANQSVLKLFP